MHCLYRTLRSLGLLGALSVVIACSANSDGEPGPLTFSRLGGLFADPFSLELSAGGSPVIRYTTDGSVPTAASTTYADPIRIEDSTTVRARVFADAIDPGPVVSHSYLRLGPDVRDFSSNLPIVVVDSFGYDIDSESGVEGDRPSYPRRPVYGVFIDAPTGGRAAMTDPHDFAGRAGMRVRGNSSQALPKKQYSFETWDEADADMDVAILGMPPESDWILHAPYSDKTLMRNFLAYRWGGELGHYTVRTRFVELFFNWNDERVGMEDYAGVYILMEKIKRGADRVDVARLTSTDGSEPAITGGYILKNDIPDLDETPFETALGSLSLIHVYPKAADIAPAQADWLHGYLNDAESALFGPAFADPDIGYAAYLDVPSFVDYHLLTEALKNADGYYASQYFHKERGGKLVIGPIWDWNTSFGLSADWDTWVTEGWLSDQVSPDWFMRLFADPAFELAWTERWVELRSSVLATDRVLAEIDATAAYLDEAAARNFARWPILGAAIEDAGGIGWVVNTPGYMERDTYDEEVDFIRTWLEDRLAWIDGQVP